MSPPPAPGTSQLPPPPQLGSLLPPPPPAAHEEASEFADVHAEDDEGGSGGGAVPPLPPARRQDSAEGYVSCDNSDNDSGFVSAASDAEGHSQPTAARYTQAWHAESSSWYHVCRDTGESFWAVPGDEQWMEVLDEASQSIFHQHSITGETKWPEVGTVWEELKDPLTQQHYFYSNVSHTAQWTQPLWVDYIEPDSGETYYYCAATGESSWERPAEFVEVAVEEPEPLEDEEILDPGMGSSVPMDNLRTPTPRYTPLPSTNGSSKRSAAEHSVEVSVAYSLSKRPRAAAPRTRSKRESDVDECEEGEPPRRKGRSQERETPPSALPPAAAVATPMDTEDEVTLDMATG